MRTSGRVCAKTICGATKLAAAPKVMERRSELGAVWGGRFLVCMGNTYIDKNTLIELVQINDKSQGMRETFHHAIEVLHCGER
jgi:hypothetical protein